MSILISALVSALLAALPKLLEWVLSLIRDNKQVPERQRAKLNHVLYYCHELNANAAAVGLTVNGTPPVVNATEGEAGELMEGLFDNWIQDFILKQLRTNGPEIFLKVMDSVALPYLREQAAKTQNKVDNVALKHFESMLHDPEFISAIEGIG